MTAILESKRQRNQIGEFSDMHMGEQSSKDLYIVGTNGDEDEAHVPMKNSFKAAVGASPNKEMEEGYHILSDSSKIRQGAAVEAMEVILDRKSINKDKYSLMQKNYNSCPSGIPMSK